MESAEKLVNKVAESGLIVIDLEQYFPEESSIVLFDLSAFLFRGLVLREKEFREALRQYPWGALEGKTVALFCSTDAIIPQWAWMLAASYLDAVTKDYHYGSREEVAAAKGLQAIAGMDIASYSGERVILKGCGHKAIVSEAYILATQRLLPVVKSLMFGEPCSTVPVYKKK